MKQLRYLLLAFIAFIAISCVKTNQQTATNCAQYTIQNGLFGTEGVKKTILSQQNLRYGINEELTQKSGLKVASIYYKADRLTDIIDKDALELCVGKDSIYIQKNNEYIFKFQLEK